jgi:hypothetical protein
LFKERVNESNPSTKRVHLSYDGTTKNAVDKLLFGDDDEDDVYDVPEGRDLRRSRTFEDFVFGSRSSLPPSPKPSPKTGRRPNKSAWLSRPSPEMKARRLKISRSAESLDSETGNGTTFDRKLFRPEVEASVDFVRTEKFENNTSGNRRIENDYDKITKSENKFEKSSPSDKKFDRNRRPPAASPFFIDFQRKFVSRRIAAEPSRTSRPGNGPMTRAKSLGQLRQPPQPRRRGSGKLVKTVSTTFQSENFESESAELLAPNSTSAVQRKETRL